MRTLDRIDAHAAPQRALFLFELQLLALAGYRPQLHRCVTCEAAIEPGANAFDPALGGVVCPACAPAQRAARPVSTAALKLLRNLQTRGEAMLGVAAPPAVLSEVEGLLGLYVQHLLERQPARLPSSTRCAGSRAPERSSLIGYHIGRVARAERRPAFVMC